MSAPFTLPERAGRAAVWNVLALGALAVLTFATGILLARVLSFGEMAAYAQFLILLSGVLAAIDLGLLASIPKFAASSAAEAGARGMLRLLGVVTCVKLLLLAALGALLLLAYAPVAQFLHVPEGASRAFLFTVLLVAGLDLVSDVLQHGLFTCLAQGAVQGIRICESVLRSGLTIAVVLAGKGVPGILGAFVAASSVRLALSASCLARQVRLLPRGGPLPPLAPLLPRLARHSATQYATKLCAWLSVPYLATAVLCMTTKAEVVAEFSVASGLLLGILEAVTAPVNSLILPLFANLVLLEDRTPMRKTFIFVVKAYALLLLPSAAGLATLAPSLFQSLYQGKYGGSVPYFRWMIATIFLEMVFYSAASSAMVTMERYALVLLSRLPILLVACGFMEAVQAWGPVSAIALLCAARLLAGFLLTAMTCSSLRVRLPAGFVLRQLVLACVLALPLWYWSRTVALSVPLLLGAILGYAVVYLACFKALGGIGAEERAAFASMRLPLKRFVMWFV